MGFRGVINVILRKQIDMSQSFSLFQPHPHPPPHPTTRRCSRAICFLNSSYFFLMTLIASIITFYKKKKIGKKRLPSTLDMEPSTLDPQQKDRLVILKIESDKRRVYLFVEGRGFHGEGEGTISRVEGRG